MDNPLLPDSTSELDILNFMQAEFASKFAKSNYCVMNAKRTTVIKDPGLNRPFITPHKNRAEQVAKGVGGVVETLHDALQHIMNHLGSSSKKRGVN